ncbi:MAG: response regulator transcription factor [Proteobacteria bacterium]|nr:response regulator transcription factor [Pseudomonadota bacterium]
MDVLIVDDHPIVHQTLGIAVGAVLPEARQHVAFNLTEALEIAEGLAKDSLVLLDLGLPEGSGMDVLKRFRSAFPQMVVVVVSATEIVAGGTYIPPQILPDVAEVPTLTGRQIEVLMLITKGASNRDIAQALGIADNTAKQHTHAVFQALNVNTRAQATIAAARLGIGTA